MTRRSLRRPPGGMAKLSTLLDWKLLAGSHKWPGPDGGTCITEAAVVVAGMPYKPITASTDAPASFSPPIVAWLLTLNDCLPDAERQQLIRFVGKLPDSADAQVEDARLALIEDEARAHFLGPAVAAGWRGPTALPDGASRRRSIEWCGEIAAFTVASASSGQRCHHMNRITAVTEAAFGLCRHVHGVDPFRALKRLEKALARLG